MVDIDPIMDITDCRWNLMLSYTTLQIKPYGSLHLQVFTGSAGKEYRRDETKNTCRSLRNLKTLGDIVRDLEWIKTQLDNFNFITNNTKTRYVSDIG